MHNNNMPMNHRGEPKPVGDANRRRNTTYLIVVEEEEGAGGEGRRP